MMVHQEDSWTRISTKIMRVSLPLMGSMTGNLLMMVIDRLCLARYSESTLEASGPAIFTAMTIIAFFSSTVAIYRSFVAQAWGRDGEEAAINEGSAGMITGLIAGLILMLLSPLIAQIPEMSNRSAVSIALESQYLFIAAYFGAFMVFNVSLASWFNGTGRTRATFFVGLVGQVCDIIFTVGLTFGKFGLPEMGMRGSAAGTLIASLIMSCLYLYLLPRELYKQLGRMLSGRVKGILSMTLFRLRRGYISGLTNGIDELGNTAFVWIAGILGSVALAANNVNLTINYMAIIPVIGLGIGCSILCGNAVGAGRYHHLQRILLVTLVIELCYVGLVAVIQVGFPELLMSLFGLSHDSEAIYTLAIDTEKVLWTYSFTFVFSMTGSAVLECLGMTRFMFWIRFLMMWGLSVPLIYYTARHYEDAPETLITLWIIGSVFELFIGVVYFLRIFKAIKNKENQLVQHGFEVKEKTHVQG
ncbi:MATE family efflux transporter [Photorhabdus luminescens]|uniref:MATE family efflux transporter n=1 Tax=Photorhabdus luminescens TaxID=29488 RepID=UPI00223EC144|nr:MATE family efflux transporter [Photorhabdus luminescens]MCW7761976.1 MATE family efflux transporter [Photorhabdus luminescens subsp. venezuelensis]